MNGDECHAQPFSTHDHHGLTAFADAFLKIFRMTGEVELLAVDGVFVDGSGDKHVNETVAQIRDGAFECGERSFTSRFRRLSYVDFTVLPDNIYDIDLIRSGIVGRINLE